MSSNPDAEGGIIAAPPGKRIVMYTDGRLTEWGTPFFLEDEDEETGE